MLSRQPRLETRDAPGGSNPQPYHPHMMPQQPGVLGADMGMYIKWALLLQEQLEQVQGEKAKLQEVVVQLQTEKLRARLGLEA